MSSQPDMTIRHLSGLLGLSHAATVRLVDRMCVDGLVTRSPSKEDGRAVGLSLTAQGRELYEKMLSTQSILVERTLSVLSKQDQAAFAQLARKLLSSRAPVLNCISAMIALDPTYRPIESPFIRCRPNL